MTSRLAPYDLDDLDQRDPARIAWLVRFYERTLARYHRPRVIGVERVPDGPVLYVGNHNAGLWSPDSFAFCHAVIEARGVDALPYGLAHEVALSLPPLNQMLVPLGAVRASHDNALRLLASGRSVLVYPGGDVDAMRPARRRGEVVFDGRRGFVRLALRAGVPIVPVATAGAHDTFRVLTDGRFIARALRLDRAFRLDVFPITLALPWGVMVGPMFYLPLPATFVTELLPPIVFDRQGEDAADDVAYVHACAARVLGDLQRAVTRLEDTLPRRARGGR